MGAAAHLSHRAYTRTVFCSPLQHPLSSAQLDNSQPGNMLMWVCFCLCHAVLGVSGVLESHSLYVAVDTLRRRAAQQGLTLLSYIKTGGQQHTMLGGLEKRAVEYHAARGGAASSRCIARTVYACTGSRVCGVCCLSTSNSNTVCEWQTKPVLGEGGANRGGANSEFVCAYVCRWTSGADPAAVAVMMEDGAAVAGLFIAGGCLALCQVRHTHRSRITPPAGHVCCWFATAPCLSGLALKGFSSSASTRLCCVLVRTMPGKACLSPSTAYEEDEANHLLVLLVLAGHWRSLLGCCWLHCSVCVAGRGRNHPHTAQQEVADWQVHAQGQHKHGTAICITNQLVLLSSRILQFAAYATCLQHVTSASCVSACVIVGAAQ